MGPSSHGSSPSRHRLETARASACAQSDSPTRPALTTWAAPYGGRASVDANGAPPLSANVRETAARPEFSVEGEQAKAAREHVIESFSSFFTPADGSDGQGHAAAFHRRVQEEGRAGGRRLHGGGPDRRPAST